VKLDSSLVKSNKVKKEFLEKAKTRRLIINGYLKHRLSLA